MTPDPHDEPRAEPLPDPAIDDAAREGPTGTAGAQAPARRREPDDYSVPPDGRPLEEQPQWRRDFAIDWPRDNFVARRDFAKFLVLTSGAFVAGQAWIAASSLLRRRRAPDFPRVRVAALAELPPGSARMFSYPEPHDACLLIRLRDDTLLAYSQKCTHLSCAVIPKLDEGVLKCPCHDGYFDLATGRNIAGPPPRPLPRILLEVSGGDVYAVGVETRMI